MEGSGDTTKWLYRFEAKGIQKWILATDKLRELKGGSSLIEELAQLGSQRAEKLMGQVRVAAAGAGEYELPNREAVERFAHDWPLFVQGHAPGLQVIQAWVPVGADEGHATRELFRRLGAARNRPAPELPEIGPWVARSGRTGGAAVGRHHGSLEDSASHAKREASMRDELVRHTGEIRLLDDFDEWGEGYLAVVHADGNAVGERVAKLSGASLRTFSSALSEVTRSAFSHAMTRLAMESPYGVRARPIVVGGDDMTIVLEAGAALPLVHAYLTDFENRAVASAGLGGPLTASAGVAFVKKGYPFHAAYELSERLCKSAKRAREGRSAISFYRVTSAVVDLDRASEGAHEGNRPAPPRRDAYTLGELQSLDDLCVTVERLPRGSLRRWLGELSVSTSRARLLWQRMKEVEGDEMTALETELQKLVGATEGEHAGLVADASTWLRLQPAAGKKYRRLWGQE